MNLEKETNRARTYQKTTERLHGLESDRETEADLQPSRPSPRRDLQTSRQEMETTLSTGAEAFY